ncbi:hemerythrin [Desulfosporosinus fructosivorans]|uniref:Hemerythrin n=1 Tax=Desulfosporosinus fructosivorans TaxID=2018669 RepID=A0A4Z0R7C7_9FIRM|nr:hemerythrin domain-containing protein [Desulfosporosinus fructosivorans]TGE38720.1 hemerythrin [Desulfosporosinus fructosivorans]
MTVIKELKNEHEAVLLTIRIIDQITSLLKSGQTVELIHLDQILEFLAVFVDKCHHSKEEKVLFPAMEAAGIPREGGPIATMLYEHEQGRSLVQGLRSGVEGYRVGKESSISEIIKNAHKYGKLLTSHIDKENNVLYVMAERVLSAEKMVAMEAEFTRIEENEVGPNKHEEFHATLHALKSIYLD